MAPDVFSLFIFLATFLKIGGTLNAAQYEIDIHKDFLATIIKNFKSVEALRNSTLGSKLVGDDLDGQLKEIRVALRKAEQRLSYCIPRDKNGNPHIGPKEILAWCLTFKSVAKSQEELLILLNDKLTEIKKEIQALIRAGKQQYPETSYFDDAQQDTWSMLCERAVRNSKIYVGPGDQLSRSVAIAILTIE